MTLPKRVRLAQLPTQIEYLSRLSATAGARLYIKRDDLTGLVTTGNKIRKLEYLVYDAMEQGCDTLVTCGGLQSNHARTTAAVAARLKLKATLVLRTPTPPERLDGNFLLDRVLGAEIVYVTPEEYKDMDTVFARVTQDLTQQGRQPYVIPEGGSNALGLFGYIGMMEELVTQIRDTDLRFDSIVCAVGTGGTYAGLLLGAKLHQWPTPIYGINVCETAAYFREHVLHLATEAIQQYGLEVTIRPGEIHIIDGYVGRGYALTRPEELEVLTRLAREDGIVLDPVYTGKAMYGLLEELKKDRRRFGEHILFLHTGGLFGLLAAGPDLAPLTGM